MTFLQSVLPANAITRAELLHQQRSARRHHLIIRWLGRMSAVATFTIAVFLFWGEFAGALLMRDAGVLTGQGFAHEYNTDLGRAAGIGAYIFCIIVLTRHFVLMLQTLTLAANSISRERQAQTWDMLVLTGMDARQIVRGKWAATVRHQWPRYLFLGVLRAGAVVWIFNVGSRMAYTSSFYNSYYYPAALEIVLPPPGSILLAGAIILLLTMMNLCFTAACGVLASVSAKRSVWALLGGIITRLMLPFTFVFGFMLLFGLFQLGRNEFFEQTWSAVSISLLDNGSIIAGLLATITIQYRGFDALDTSSTVLYAVIALLVVVAAYATLTVGLLNMAQRRAVREQALPPLKLGTDQSPVATQQR